MGLFVRYGNNWNCPDGTCEIPGTSTHIDSRGFDSQELITKIITIMQHTMLNHRFLGDLRGLLH